MEIEEKNQNKSVKPALISFLGSICVCTAVILIVYLSTRKIPENIVELTNEEKASLVNQKLLEIATNQYQEIEGINSSNEDSKKATSIFALSYSKNYEFCFSANLDDGSILDLSFEFKQSELDLNEALNLIISKDFNINSFNMNYANKNSVINDDTNFKNNEDLQDIFDESTCKINYKVASYPNPNKRTISGTIKGKDNCFYSFVNYEYDESTSYNFSLDNEKITTVTNGSDSKVAYLYFSNYVIL